MDRCHCGAALGDAGAHAEDCPWACSSDDGLALSAWLRDRVELRSAWSRSLADELVAQRASVWATVR